MQLIDFDIFAFCLKIIWNDLKRKNTKFGNNVCAQENFQKSIFRKLNNSATQRNQRNLKFCQLVGNRWEKLDAKFSFWEIGIYLEIGLQITWQLLNQILFFKISISMASISLNWNICNGSYGIFWNIAVFVFFFFRKWLSTPQLWS